MADVVRCLIVDPLTEPFPELVLVVVGTLRDIPERRRRYVVVRRVRYEVVLDVHRSLTSAHVDRRRLDLSPLPLLEHDADVPLSRRKPHRRLTAPMKRPGLRVHLIERQT